MTTPKQHQDTPTLNTPVYRHSSETVRSPKDAGGKVPPAHYEDTTEKKA